MLLHSFVCLAAFCALAAGFWTPFASAKTKQKGHFKIDQVPNGVARRNGPAEYAFAHLKYGLEVPDGLAKAASRFSKLSSADGPGGSSEVPAWAQEFDIEYLSPVMVGDPGQLVFLNFDTGSSDTWMYSSETFVGHMAGQRFYSPEKSSTSERIKNATWSILYGDGSSANGIAYRDLMSIGDLLIPNMTIQTASYVSSMIMQDLNMSGLAGLCINHPSTVGPRQPSLLDMLEPVLEEHVFTADLRHRDTGRYRFGKVDKEDYVGDIKWAAMNKTSKYWQFDLNGIHVGDDPNWYFATWPMIVDTGTTLMLVQPDLAEMYYSKVPGATYDDWFASYSFPCNQSGALPDWEFDIAGLRGKVPGRYFNYQNISATECYGGIQPFPVDLGFGILGDVFLKAVLAVFDVQNKTVGFANKELKA
ncbi:hypothetical protein RB597_009829 [Gaeumannomyces tritici]